LTLSADDWVTGAVERDWTPGDLLAWMTLVYGNRATAFDLLRTSAILAGKEPGETVTPLCGHRVRSSLRQVLRDTHPSSWSGPHGLW